MKSKMRIMLAVLGGIAFATTTEAQTISLGPVTHPDTGNRYYLLETPSWAAAEAWAVARGAHLVAISSSFENTWVRDKVLSPDGVPRKAYLGLNDSQVEGTFVWSNGQSVSYTNWDTAEPDPGTPMDYAVMFLDGSWHARPNAEPQFALVEFKGEIRVPQEISSIQGAIHAALTGATILVGPGTYFERPVISDKRLTIRGVEDASSTIIDAQSGGRALVIVGTDADDCIIDRLTMRNGYTATVGAGLLVDTEQVTINNCIFHHNIADVTASAIFTNGVSVISNCLMYENQAGSGSVVHVHGAIAVATRIANCTIVNPPAIQGAAISSHMSDIEVRNSILWCQPNSVLGITDVAYCDTIDGVEGPGNISANPQFLPGYRLSATSPCIDAGMTEAVPLCGFGLPRDCGSKLRFVDDPATPNHGVGPGPIVDMGAMEFQAPPITLTVGDMNGDGVVNGLDVAPFIALLLP